MKKVILKTNLDLGDGKRAMKGCMIRVSDQDYDRLVPRLAHDAADYMAKEAEKSERYKAEHPEQVKAFEAAQKARHDRVAAHLADAERAAKAKDAEAAAKKAAAEKVAAARAARTAAKGQPVG